MQHLNHIVPRVTAVLCLALAAACATKQPQPDAKPKSAQGPSAPASAAAKSGSAKSAAAKKGDAAALTLVAEMALKQGDCRQASESFAQAAAVGTVELASRAAQVSLACEHLPAAWTAVQRWRTLAPADPDANAFYAAVAIKLYHLPEARTGIGDYWRAEQANARQKADQHKIGEGEGKAHPEEPGDRAERALLESEAHLTELTSLLIDQSNDASAVLAALSGAVEPGASPEILTLLGGVALDAFDAQKAINYAQQALAKDSTDLAARSVLARAYVMKGDGPKAIATAREIMSQRASSYEMADILAALDRFEEAHQELERLRAAGVPEAEINLHLAQLAIEEGDFKNAQDRLSDLLENGQGNEKAMLLLADIAARQGDTDAAIAAYRRLYDSSVAVQARSHSAGLLLAKGNRTEAVTLLDDYAADHPEEEYDLTLTKAHLLADNGDAEAGLALLSAALERHPKHPNIEYQRAVLLEQAGHVKESVDSLKKLLAERPDDPTLLNSLGYTMADHNLELSRAEELIRRALGSIPDSPSVLDSLGWVRFRQGDNRAAVNLLGHAYSLEHDPEIAAHWGEVLWVSGDHQQARKVWAQALAREPDSRELKATVARFVPETPARPSEGH